MKISNFWFFFEIDLLISLHTEKIQMGVGTIQFFIEFSIWERETPNLGILF